MKNLIKLIPIAIITLSTMVCYGQDSTWSREYQIGVYSQYDLRNSSTNGLTVNRMLHDGYRKHIKSKMNEKLGNVTYGFYSFAATYMSMVWSHEIGHSLRAQQVGGAFKIHNAELPIPYTTMHLPADINYVDEALSVTGGFEVNHLTAMNIQQEFISQNGTYNEDLAFAFANRIMHTIYTSIIVPIDPEKKEVWIKTAGDPVHCILPVFKNYSGNQVFMADSSVNPELVSYYKESLIFGSFFGLLDPQFYKEAGATFGSSSKVRRPVFLLGDYENGWTYGTMFNVSPLGYELYLSNYIHLNSKQFTAYAKYGKPFKNNGFGVRWNNLINSDKLLVSSQIDVWDQAIFGSGFSAELQSKLRIGERLSLNSTLGYKTEGYVIGKQVKSGLNLGFGVSILTSY
jgi:hypothetical protein